jgi:hypothetical protein
LILYVVLVVFGILFLKELLWLVCF